MSENTNTFNLDNFKTNYCKLGTKLAVLGKDIPRSAYNNTFKKKEDFDLTSDEKKQILSPYLLKKLLKPDENNDIITIANDYIKNNNLCQNDDCENLDTEGIINTILRNNPDYDYSKNEEEIIDEITNTKSRDDKYEVTKLLKEILYEYLNTELVLKHSWDLDYLTDFDWLENGSCPQKLKNIFGGPTGICPDSGLLHGIYAHHGIYTRPVSVPNRVYINWIRDKINGQSGNKFCKVFDKCGLLQFAYDKAEKEYNKRYNAWICFVVSIILLLITIVLLQHLPIIKHVFIIFKYIINSFRNRSESYDVYEEPDNEPVSDDIFSKRTVAGAICLIAFIVLFGIYGRVDGQLQTTKPEDISKEKVCKKFKNYEYPRSVYLK